MQVIRVELQRAIEDLHGDGNRPLYQVKGIKPNCPPALISHTLGASPREHWVPYHVKVTQ